MVRIYNAKEVDGQARCLILAVFARVGIFGTSSTIPVVVEFKPSPLETHKGWGARAIFILAAKSFPRSCRR